MTSAPAASLDGRSRLSVVFGPRAEPLEPCAALARGDAAERLCTRLLAKSDEELSQLEGVASPRVLLVLGNAESLPWVDGIEYFGRDSEAPSILLPTALCPNVPAAWLARALAKRTSDAGRTGLWIVVPEPPLLVPASSRLRLARSALEAWLRMAREDRAPDPPAPGGGPP